jgi:hypothetical protein
MTTTPIVVVFTTVVCWTTVLRMVVGLKTSVETVEMRTTSVVNVIGWVLTTSTVLKTVVALEAPAPTPAAPPISNPTTKPTTSNNWGRIPITQSHIIYVFIIMEKKRTNPKRAQIPQENSSGIILPESHIIA